MLVNYLMVFGIALIPFVELRLAIPLGIGMGLSPVLVFLTAVIADILLGFLLIEILYLLDKWIPHWKLLGIGKFYLRTRKKAHRKISHFTEKYGLVGVALFIAVPLPGSGVYTGSLGAFLIALEKKRFRLACVIGATISGLVVTLLSLGVFGLFR
ncbi:small multi-drug export protein [Candidatus Woesearchaeota archaeon]|nr:small multi-drug export protein [Candidatus Woesearchaeota archaeon]